MASEIDFASLEIFCRNIECGDPVPNANGARTRRRMNFIKEDTGLFVPRYGHYRCPVCGDWRDIDTAGRDC